MRTISLALGTLVALTTGPAIAATSGTCTITSVAASIAGGGPGSLLLPPVTSATGLAMPVTFDETTGAFSMSRDAWASTFGSGGAEEPTGFGSGSDYFLIMAPGTITGTLDSGGNVVLPGFGFTFATDVCQPPNNSYPLLADLDSGLQFLTLGLTPVEAHGTALDFATGSVTLMGADVIPAPCLTSPLVSAMTLICTLSPIPDKTKLPPPPALTKLTGLAKIGKPLPPTQPSTPDKGDVMRLGGKLAPGAAKLDFTVDVFIRIADASGNDLVLVEVPAGKLTPKGKGFQVVDRPPGKNGTDPDGIVIQVLVGQKANGTVTSATAGTIRFTVSKKGIQIKGLLQGLDLSALSKSGTATVAVGPYAMTAPFTVHGAGKSRRIH